MGKKQYEFTDFPPIPLKNEIPAIPPHQNAMSLQSFAAALTKYEQSVKREANSGITSSPLPTAECM